MKKIKKVLVYAGLALLAFGVVKLSFVVWRFEHPNAPTWTFFIGNK